MSATLNATPLMALDCLVLDTETTGLDARTARIVQIGAVPVRGGRLVAEGRIDRLVNPGIPIPKATTAVHGIDDATAATAPPFGTVFGEIGPLISGSVIVGHTIDYDLTVLAREAELAGIAWTPPRALDVRTLARIAAPTLAHHDLDRLCGWLGIEIKGRHTAAGDAEATAQVYLALIPKLRERGVRTLAEAEAASRRLAEREAQRLTGHSATIVSTEPAAGAVPALQRIDSFPFRHRIRDVMSAPPLTAEGSTTVDEAIRVLIERKVSSLFVRAGSGPTGIVTERDLLRAIDRDGAPALARPIADLMHAPLVSVREDDFVYRAIGRVERHNIRHLAVTDAEGRLVGAVTTRNLLRHRSTTAIALGDEIASGQDSVALGRAWAKLAPMAASLVAEEVDPRTVAAVISGEVCAMTARAAELAEARMEAQGKGSPPVAYCVLVLGSAGRGESLLAADQDNAIVYASGEPGGAEDRWFAELGLIMTSILDEAGVPLCKGGVMARNEAWRMSVERWHGTIEGWLGRQRPKDLLNVDIFFDAVPVHGAASLGDEIVEHAFVRARAARDMLSLLTELARDHRAPFTLLGNIRTDEAGRVDLKKHGLMPIFTAARILAIRNGIRAVSTPERLERAQASVAGSVGNVQALIEAHREIMGFVLAQQLADALKGVPLSPRVEIAPLDKAARARLKSALTRVGIAVELVGEGRI